MALAEFRTLCPKDEPLLDGTTDLDCASSKSSYYLDKDIKYSKIYELGSGHVKVPSLERR
jgi:hypothetical protein